MQIGKNLLCKPSLSSLLSSILYANKFMTFFSPQVIMIATCRNCIQESIVFIKNSTIIFKILFYNAFVVTFLLIKQFPFQLLKNSPCFARNYPTCIKTQRLLHIHPKNAFLVYVGLNKINLSEQRHKYLAFFFT